MDPSHALASGELKNEHKLILRMLDIVEEACRRLESGDNVSAKVFDEVTDFITTFADKCHHGKEQDTLFPLMGERGFPTEMGPIAVMLIEHDQGREFVRGLVDATKRYGGRDDEAVAGVIQNARGYVELLRQHIYKEDNMLYPLGDKVLTREDDERLLREFERIERDVIGSEKHEYYVHMVGQLEKEFGIHGTT